MLKNLAWFGGLVILPLVVFALLTTISLPAQAQSEPPHVVIGTAQTNGSPVAAGSTVTAWGGNEQIGSATTTEGGHFILQIGRTSGIIRFKINGTSANETIPYWEQGGQTGSGSNRFILTTADPDATPWPTPTPTPRPTATPTPTPDGQWVLATPSTALANQRITLVGTGSTPNSRIAGGSGGIDPSITIGGYVIPVANINDGDPVSVDNGGKWSASLDLPLRDVTTRDGIREIRVRDSGGRTVTGNITIPARVVTIDPAAGRGGTTATVRGENFPSRNDNGESFNISIAYDTGSGRPTTVSTVSDAGGRFEEEIRIPTSVLIPSTNTVRVSFLDEEEVEVTTTATHEVPPATLTLSATSGAPGSAITLRGEGFKTFVPVTGIWFSSIDVLPSPAPATDAQGNTEFDIRIPDLAPGRHTIVVQTSSATASIDYFTVTSASNPAPTATPTPTPPRPTVTLSANSGPPGSTITLRGEHFGAFVAVLRAWASRTRGGLGNDVLPSPPPATDAQGTAEFDIRIPDHTPGRIVVGMQTDVGWDQAYFTVTAASAPTPRPTPTPTGAYLVLHDYTAPPGQILYVKAFGFEPNSPARFFIDSIEITPNPRPSTNSQGMAEFEVLIPGLDPGQYVAAFHAGTHGIGQYFTIVAASCPLATGTSDPTLTLSRDSGAPGTVITLSGQGFRGYMPIRSVSVGSIDVTPSPAPSTNCFGEMQFDILIPGLDNGNQVIAVQVNDTKSSVWFNITPVPTPVPTPAPAPPQLPGGSSEPPHIFTGQATLNGSPAGTGIAIDAYDGGRLIGATVTQSGGRYTIHVHRSAGIITFRVNQQAAAESWTTWQQGQVTPGFNLTAAAGSSESDPSRLFAVLPDLVRAFSFDNATKQWDFFDPVVPEVSTLTRFMPGNIYWLLVSHTTRLMLNGVEHDLSCVGDDCWNLIVW